MPLLTIRDLGIGFRGPALLDGVDCQIEAGERIGLLGRNGAGKTTFMRMLCGDVVPDHGSLEFAPGARVSLLPQDVPQDISGRIHDVVLAGAGEAFRPAATVVANEAAIDAEAAWQIEHRVEQTLSR
ncbi:MAG: ABC-F family ATP-binding cassette domain-containing protein, partial [Planctomycetales bacterium]|nr:ABC-F family ATP-binding cassette domain-containing protein [Planctomycetales bacterium]